MGRVKRGGYIFETWIGDHPPRHVHVIKDRTLVARIELDDNLTVMDGMKNRRIHRILKKIMKDGLLK